MRARLVEPQTAAIFGDDAAAVIVGACEQSDTARLIASRMSTYGAFQFSPIVTDFCRTTQPIVRYRLDDVLTVGRADGAIVLTRRRDGARVPLYPDFVARAILGSAAAATAGAAGPAIDDFRVEQTAPGHLQMLLASADPARARMDVAANLQALFDGHGLIAPAVTFGAMTAADFLTKRRRIRRAPGITH